MKAIVSHEVKNQKGWKFYLSDAALVVVIIAPFVALVMFSFVFALHMRLSETFMWILVFLLLYSLGLIGVALGAHRGLTHNAFKTGTKMWIALLVCFCMSIESAVDKWVWTHSVHHAFADKIGDFHSPYAPPAINMGKLAWIWKKDLEVGWFALAWAHLGWMIFWFRPFDKTSKFYPKRKEEPIIAFFSKWWWAFGFSISFGLPMLIGSTYGWIIGGNILAYALHGLAVGAMCVGARHHATWCINSYCHWKGVQEFPIDNQARDNEWLAIPTVGESEHWFHHMAQNAGVLMVMPEDGKYSAWKLFRRDPVGLLLLKLQDIGLVYKVQIVTQSDYDRRKKSYAGQLARRDQV